MKTYQNFLLMTDMDGTLIDSNHRISPENIAAIRYFTEQGGRFTVATGRTQNNCAPYMQGLAINAPCIFYNGAVLYDWQEQCFLRTHSLKSPSLPDFLRNCMDRFPALGVQIYTEEALYAINHPEHDDRIMLAERQEFRRSTMADLEGRDWIKVLLCGDKESLRTCQKISTEYGLDQSANHFYSSPIYLEFVDRQVSKGHMLQELRLWDTLRGKTIVAAGDFHNDIAMLHQADYGIAPSNAQPEVLAAADLVTVSNDEHLLAHIIYEILPTLNLERTASGMRT